MKYIFTSDAHRIALLIWNLTRSVFQHFLQRIVNGDQDKAAFGRTLRLFAERMGVTYVKLGQYLALRYDLLSAESCDELSKLMCDVPSVSFEVVRELVETELGGPIESFYQQFERTPIAAASIAQVHKAVARDGMVLAVKLQRPGIERDLRSDLRNLHRVASIAAWLGIGGGMSLVQVIQELSTFTLREVDFLLEARTADTVRRESPPFVKIPRIRWDMTTSRVMSMEFIVGVSLLELCQLSESSNAPAFEAFVPGVEPKVIATRLVQACLTQQYITGNFHGDPHPANILISADGTISFIDFGIFGEITLPERRLLVQYVSNLAMGRLAKAFHYYEELLSYGKDTDITVFRSETIAAQKRWFTASSNPKCRIEEKLGAKSQIELMSIMRRHHVRINPNQVLFWRTQAVLDATAHRLPIDFDMLKVVAEFLQSAGVEKALGTGTSDNKRLAIGLSETLRMLTNSTPIINELSRNLALGSFSMRVEGRPSRVSRLRRNLVNTALARTIAGVGFIASAGALLTLGLENVLISLLVLIMACLVWVGSWWRTIQSGSRPS